jgi:hypothetical protein
MNNRQRKMLAVLKKPKAGVRQMRREFKNIMSTLEPCHESKEAFKKISRKP